MSIKHLFIYLFICLLSCSPTKNESINNAYSVSMNSIGKTEYYNIYKKACDSIFFWSTNNLGYYQYLGKSKNYNLDSLVCFSQNNDRLISCILMGNLLKEANSDGIDFFYGEKINNKWYFYSGPHIVCPRNMFKYHPINQPLSYAQLHQIALKEVYGGYLKSDGSINEAWFTSHFEDIGWGDFNDQTSSLKYLGLKPNEKFTDKRKFFEAIHLQSVKNNWYQWWKQDSIKKSKENIN